MQHGNTKALRIDYEKTELREFSAKTSTTMTHLNVITSNYGDFKIYFLVFVVYLLLHFLAGKSVYTYIPPSLNAFHPLIMSFRHKMFIICKNLVRSLKN